MLYEIDKMKDISMDFEKYDFEKLAQIIEKYNLTEIKFIQDSTKIILKRNNKFKPNSDYYNFVHSQDYEKFLADKKIENTNIENLKQITNKKTIQDELVLQNETNSENIENNEYVDDEDDD